MEYGEKRRDVIDVARSPRATSIKQPMPSLPLRRQQAAQSNR
jgi:hypothetical protein